MGYSFVQKAENSSATGVASLQTPSITTTAGNSLYIAVATSGNDTLTMTDNAGTQNTFVNVDHAHPASGPWLWQFRVQSLTGGPAQFTISTVGSTAQGIVVMEYNGLGAFIGFEGQNQATPGLGSNATTSTALPVVTAPAVVIGISQNITPAGGPTAGTGAFNDRGLIWANLFAGGCARVEDIHVTATGSQAATFTATANQSHTTMCLGFLEALPPPVVGAMYHRQYQHFYI